jgi:hypothetical protein
MQIAMIKYKSNDELVFAKYYANKLHDKLATKILETGSVKNAAEAIHLSVFFWKLVDSAIEDENNQTKLPWTEGSEFLSERLMYSLSGYLENAGYDNIWEEISEKHNQ